MSDKNRNEKPVLVVGAGPVGLTMASQLVCNGLPVRIIDKAAEASATSKALGVHARTLEVLEDMGLIERFLETGRPVHGVNVYYDGKRIVHLTLDELVCPYPFVLVIPQSETEKILAEHASSLGIQVERNIELTGFEQDAETVVARLRHADGREETFETNWLLGCDGAHSMVRKTLGLPFEGAAYEELFAAADVAAESNLDDDELHVFMSDEGVVAGFPFGKGRYRLVLDEAPDTPSSTPPTLEQIQSYVDRRIPAGMRLSDPHWLTWFRIHRRMVPQYRKGRVFLAGDAGHIHSPLGGQGMNTGIQDAYNLSWKLALVIKGAADDALLDSYNAERHPVAANVLMGTDLATKVATIRNPVGQKVRNNLASFLTSLEVIQHRMQKTVSMMLVNYRTSPIVGEHRQGLSSVKFFGSGGTENPDLSDWMDFGRGPSAGDRAPDAIMLSAENGELTRVFQATRGTSHHLFLFDGKPTAEGYENLENIARFVRDEYGEHITPHVVVPASEKPAGLDWDGAIWLDPDLSAHQTYGAGSECLYLIRPDGYVGFRSQPADLTALKQYLGSIFRIHATTAV